MALRESAGLPRLVWGGDHIDEGHRKLFAAELLGSLPFIPDVRGIHKGFFFIDAAVPQRRRVPGFGKRSLVVILKRMRLTEKPTFTADVESGIASGVEDDVDVSDYSDDAGDSSAFSFGDSAAGVGSQSGASGDDRAHDDEDDENAVVDDSGGEDSQYWGLGNDGQGARWDDVDEQGDQTFAEDEPPAGAEEEGT